MSSFYDQIFSEIDAARKMAADFSNRHGRTPVGMPRVPSEAERLAQEEAAGAEIAALAVEEERLASQARERAERRAKARAEENVNAVQPQEITAAPEPAESRWNAVEILKGLAKLRVKERSAAEDLIRKAQEVRDENPPGVTDRAPEGRELRAEASAPAAPEIPAPSDGSSQVWYFTSLGTRCGPVTFGELRTMATSQVLDPRLDMVWKEGMEGWKQAGLLDGLFARRSVPAEAPDKRGGKKPEAVAALPTDLTAALASKHMQWPGVGRVALWLGLLVFPVLWTQLLEYGQPALVAAVGSAMWSQLLPFSFFVPVCVSIYLVLMRLMNVGMSCWWALVLAIPVVNIWVAFRCLVCPSGYAYHRKMDRAGILTTLAIVVVAPAMWYIHLKFPGLLTLERLEIALHRMIGGAEKVASPP